MRETIPLNRGWFFARGFSENDFSPSCPPPGEQVELPHANTLLPYNYLDETSYQFVSCYLRLLCAPASWAGRRVFLAFEGVMACAEVFCNGRLAGSHKGGYTAFRVELTELLVPGAENRLLVRVDSTERADFPPCGNVVDYLTYGGIYREVTLLVTEREAIRHLAVSPVRTPSGERLELRVELEEPLARDAQLRADILGHGARLQALLPAPAGSSVLHIAFDDTSSLRRWSPEEPVLYDARTTLLRDGQELDRLSARFGFRLCEFRPDGFYLNGRRRKLVGFNRHQSYPYVGNAMPRRIQRRDAEFIKELGANTVRTSHYPQSRHFLDRCDELGLLVFEEIPGWQHIGGPAWQDAAVRNVEEMIRADYNHPSIILWGVRINESADDPAFYARTNAKAHELDQTRQTGGVRCHPRGDFQEDVYTFNDFIHSGGPLVFRSRQEITGLPQEVPLLVTESNGHMYPTKRFDPEARLLEHAMRHLRVRDEALGRSDLVGELSWCAFDYNTHGCFGSGDKICYHGVSDMFRIPKFAGLACMSQRPLAEGAVLEPLSLVSRGERDGGGIIPIWVATNCDCVRVDNNGALVGDFYPERAQFPHLPHPPVRISHLMPRNLPLPLPEDLAADFMHLVTQRAAQGILPDLLDEDYPFLEALSLKAGLERGALTALLFESAGGWGQAGNDLRLEGIVNGEVAVTRRAGEIKSFARLEAVADDTVLAADGDTYDATRIVVRALDTHGNLCPFYNGAASVRTDGIVDVMGPASFGLIGGCVAFWVRTCGRAGTARISVECGGSRTSLSLSVTCDM